MTPKRKAALQWFHDNPGVIRSSYQSLWPQGAPSRQMVKLALKDGALGRVKIGRIDGGIGLTDKGRRDLHEASA